MDPGWPSEGAFGWADLMVKGHFKCRGEEGEAGHEREALKGSLSLSNASYLCPPCEPVYWKYGKDKGTSLFLIWR